MASGNLYTRQFSYNAANNQVTQIANSAGTAYANNISYDATGNTLTTNNRVYTWDYVNQMRSFALMAGGSVSTFAQYLYDASGARVKKFVLNPATNAYNSVTYIDGVFEYETSVTVSLTQRKNYIYLQGGIQFRVGSFSGDIANTIIYQISDYLGSAGTRLDDTGGIIDKEEYYPYGDSSLRTFTSKRYRYIGKEKDNESGLYQMGARYYAPWTCKFISVDPKAANTSHESSYCYGDNNPIVLSDPSGMQTPAQGAPQQDYAWSIGTVSSGVSNSSGNSKQIQAIGTNSPVPEHKTPVQTIYASKTMPAPSMAMQVNQQSSIPDIKQNITQNEQAKVSYASQQAQQAYENAHPVLISNAQGNGGVIGGESNVTSMVENQKNEIKNQLGEDIASGPLASGTYMITDNSTIVHQAALVDIAASAVGGDRITYESITTLQGKPAATTEIEPPTKINVWGEGESPGYNNYATNPDAAKITTTNSPLVGNLRPLTENIKTSSVDDIKMNNSPVSTETLDEIYRIAKNGATFSFSASSTATIPFDNVAKYFSETGRGTLIFDETRSMIHPFYSDWGPMQIRIMTFTITK